MYSDTDMMIREATLGDEDLLIVLMGEFYVVEHLPFDESALRAALRQLLAERSWGLVRIASVDDAPAGYMILTFGFSLEFRGRDALVDELYVRETMRGKGVGSALLREAERICRDEAIGALHLEVDHTNLRAKELYHRSGYRDHNRHLLTKWL